jgi:L-lactate dehydrogenase
VILADQRSILTVCTPHAEIAGVSNVTLSLPQLVGGSGILDTFVPALSPDEQSALSASASVIREAIAGLEGEGVL